MTKARAALSYVYVRYLGRSGHKLAKVLAVSSQSVYAASSRIEGDKVIKFRPPDIAMQKPRKISIFK